MRYLLCHKESPVLSFEPDENYSSLKVLEVFDRKFVPVGINKENYNDISDEIDNAKFLNWWKNRAIPTGRKNIEKALEILNVSSIEELIDRTRSLNLTDQYWTKKEDDDTRWGEVNYFDNDFDDSIGQFLLLERERTFSNGTYNSPDLFTDGMLPKKWIKKDGITYLLKGSDSAFRQEPFNEALASYICYKLGIPHADYRVNELPDDGTGAEYFSLCRNFVTRDTEFIPAYDVSEALRKKNNESGYQHFFRCCSLLGIKDVEKDIHRMLALDFIMANTDRHFRNFGFLRNADTLEWLGLAPVYDTEKSMFLGNPIPKTSYAAIDIRARPFKDNQAEQFNILDISVLRELPFRNLQDAPAWFDKILQSNVYISEERRKLLCENLKSRVNSITYLVENEKKIPITKNRHRRSLERLQGITVVALDYPWA